MGQPRQSMDAVSRKDGTSQSLSSSVHTLPICEASCPLMGANVPIRPWRWSRSMRSSRRRPSSMPRYRRWSSAGESLGSREASRFPSLSRIDRRSMGNCGSMRVLGMGDPIRSYPTRTLGERNRQRRPSPRPSSLHGQPGDELLGARALVVASVHELDGPIHDIEDRDVGGCSRLQRAQARNAIDDLRRLPGRARHHFFEGDAEVQELRHDVGKHGVAGRVDAHPVEITRDGVGLASLLQRRLADRVVEAAAAVAHVEDHAALLRRLGGGNELSVLDDVVARPAEGVRQDISRSQEIEEVRYRAGGVADVAHDAKLRTGHAGGANGSPQGLQPVLAHHGLGHSHLDAERDVGILRHGLGAQVDVGVLDIDHLADLTGSREPDGGDVHEGKQACASLRPRPVREHAEVHGPRIARRHCRGRAGDADQLIGRETNADVWAEVRVEIDESRREQAAPRIDALGRAVDGDARSDQSDLAALDADVALAPQTLARIEHVGVGDDHVELEGGIPGIEAHGYRRHHLASARLRLSLRHLGAEQPAGRCRGAPELDEIATGDVHVSSSDGRRGAPVKWLRKRPMLDGGPWKRQASERPSVVTRGTSAAGGGGASRRPWVSSAAEVSPRALAREVKRRKKVEASITTLPRSERGTRVSKSPSGVAEMARPAMSTKCKNMPEALIGRRIEERKAFQIPSEARNVPITACTSMRWLRFGKCGPPSTTWRRAPGMVSATRRDMATVGKLSSDPAITCTGHRMRAQSASQSLRSKVSWRRARREATECCRKRLVTSAYRSGRSLSRRKAASPIRRRTLASKYSSNRPASTSGRWAAHHALSASGAGYGGPLMETTACTRAGACTAVHRERAAPIEAPPHTARSMPRASSQRSRSSIFLA